MGLTKSYISDLTERADAGDIEARLTLSAAGLWETDEQREARRIYEEEIPFGFGESFDSDTGFPLDVDESDVEDFEPLGLDRFWTKED